MASDAAECVRRDCETRYLVRTLVSNLRVGANWRSVIGALARATLLHSEATRPTKVILSAWPTWSHVLTKQVRNTAAVHLSWSFKVCRSVYHSTLARSLVSSI